MFFHPVQICSTLASHTTQLTPLSEITSSCSMMATLASLLVRANPNSTNLCFATPQLITTAHAYNSMVTM